MDCIFFKFMRPQRKTLKSNVVDEIGSINPRNIIAHIVYQSMFIFH